MRIELIYDRSCPNRLKARAALQEALIQAGIRSSWTEWDRSDPKAPSYVRDFGSPSLLVDGQDVAGGGPDQKGDSCRLYRQPDGKLTGSPPVAIISEALRRVLLHAALVT